MRKIDLNENEVVFAPKGGKPGYIINGKWFPVNEKDYNTPALQKELERYARLRGQEQLKKDQESLKSQSSQSTQPQNPTPPVVSIPVDPAPPTPAPTDTPDTPAPTDTPAPAKTYKVDGEDMTAERIRQEYDKRRYNKDGKLKPLKDLGDASGFGNRANKAVFPNQRVTRRMQQQNPSNAATGGVNPRAGSYAMMQKANMDNLTSNFGASPVGTIKPVAKRTMKKEAYDLVLDYLLSEGHVDTVEEAHYVMLQMTSEHVQQVVEERTAADPKMKARMGHSNPAINGKPVLYPKGHPEEGKPMSFNKAETDGVNMYRRASEKAGRKIYADEPLPKK